MLRYLSADIICSEPGFREANSFREHSSRKAVSFEKQIMSKEKYPSIISPQMEDIVIIILQIFFATFAVLKTGEYSRIFLSFISWEIFGHLTCLDQASIDRNFLLKTKGIMVGSRIVRKSLLHSYTAWLFKRNSNNLNIF